MSVGSSEVLTYITNSYNVMSHDSDVESPIRAKKRRLDHLTWEEKMQRKKLKNRVAAQTSRDRKKAKMEQMESTLQELIDRNDKVLEECENLRFLNEKLMLENAELQKKSQAPCVNCSQNRCADYAVQNRLGSAVSTEINPLPKGVLNKQQSATSLTSQQMTTMALWKIVVACLLYQTSSTNSTQTSTFNHLSKSLKVSCKISPQTWKQLLQKQIFKKFLQSKVRGQDPVKSMNNMFAHNISERTNLCRIPPQKKPKVGEHSKMVGTTPELLEPCRRENVRDEELESEISKYLRLYHDYSAKPQQNKENKKCNVAQRKTIKTNRNTPFFRTNSNKLSTKTKLKNIKPKTSQKPSGSIIANENIPKKTNESLESSEYVYGTYDEANNCITIIVNEDDVCLEEAITEVTTSTDESSDCSIISDCPLQSQEEITKDDSNDKNFLNVPMVTSMSSPSNSFRSDSSDCGYESLSSPLSLESNDIDIWDQSISELFPSLL